MPDPIFLLTAILLLLPVVALLGFTGCGLLLDYDPPDGADEWLLIEPTEATLRPGETVEFRVRTLPREFLGGGSGVRIPPEPDVILDPLLDPPLGTLERLMPAEANHWIYTAPPTMDSMMTVTVTARGRRPGASPEEATAQATVTLLPGDPSGLTVTIEPDEVALGPAGSVLLTVTTTPPDALLGAPVLTPAGIGRLDPGSLPRTWTYTAPAVIDATTPASVSVGITATRGGLSASDAARIDLVPVVVVVRPPVAVLRPGQSQIFIATVNGADSTTPAGRVTWSPNASGGLYVAASPFRPSDPATDTVTATSVRWPAAPPGTALIRRLGPVLRINCGGPLLVDPAGEADWLADARDGSYSSTFFDVVDHVPVGASGTVVSFPAAFPGDPRFAGLDVRYLTCKQGIDFSYVFRGFNPAAGYRITLNFFDLISGVGGRNANVTVADAAGARAAIMIVPTPDVRTPLTPPIGRDVVIDPLVTPRPDGSFDIRFTVVDAVNAVALVNAIQVELV